MTTDEIGLKAWFVWIDDEWGDFVHGETANEAKKEFWREWHTEADEWIRLRPRRQPDLDGKAITSESIFDKYGLEDWRPICKCSLCRPQEVI